MTANRLTGIVRTSSQSKTRPPQSAIPKVGIVRTGSLFLAFAMLVTACGSGATTPELGAGLRSSSNEPSSATSDSDSASGSASVDSGTEAEVGSGAEAESAGEVAAGPVAPTPDHLFPDVDVLDIQTGATLNIASELAGGDRPVLLWFWAPH